MAVIVCLQLSFVVLNLCSPITNYCFFFFLFFLSNTFRYFKCCSYWLLPPKLTLPEYITDTALLLVQQAEAMKKQTTTRLSRAWVASLRRAGMSVREISCATGISVNTVYRWLQKWAEDAKMHTLSPPRMPHHSPLLQNAEATSLQFNCSTDYDSFPHTYKQQTKDITDCQLLAFCEALLRRNEEQQKLRNASLYFKSFWFYMNK